MAEQKVAKPIKKIADAAQQVVRSESAPPHVRHYRAWLFRVALVSIAGAFAALTFLVKAIPFFALDLKVTRAVQLINLPAFALVMNLISWPGFDPQAIFIAGVIILLIYGLGLHWEAAMALIAAVSTTGINVLVKDLVQRPRPTPDMVNVYAKLTSFSFPSGHVMFYCGFFGFIGFLAYSLLKPSLKRSLLLVLFGGLVILIGASRIYLGEHWASDVLGSYLLGSLTLVAIIQIYLWGKTRFFVHQPVAASKPQQV